MESANSVGRVVGLMFLLQLLLAPLVHLRLLPPVTTADPGTITTAGASEVRVGVLLSLVLGALTLGIAIAAAPLFRRYSERMALAFVVLPVVGLSALAIESIAIRDMLSLALAYAATSTGGELPQALGPLARASWISAHFTTLMLAHATGLLFHAILFRFALVPRAVAASGIAATLVSVVGVTMPLLGFAFVFLTLAPVAVSQLIVVAWLLARGFTEASPGAADGAGRPELARA